MNLISAIRQTAFVVSVIASIFLWVLLAKRIGSRFPLFPLVVLSILNFAALGALVYLFAAPTKTGVSVEEHEAQVYAFAEIAVSLIVILLLLLPPTLLLWLVRLRTKR
jgi:hypothetical protein